jgi:hypothetical protein
MRGLLLAVLILGGVVAGPWPARAAEPDDEPTSDEIVRDQLQALDDLQRAETDEDADAAAKRFDDAAGHELEKRRTTLDTLIEK